MSPNVGGRGVEVNPDTIPVTTEVCKEDKNITTLPVGK
jgi:hypothetical protein